MSYNLWEALVLALICCAVKIEPSNRTSREKRYIFIPLNIPLPNRPSAQTQSSTTLAPGTSGGDQLPAAAVDIDNSILLLINSFRAAHRAPPVTYSPELKTLAKNCANQLVAIPSLAPESDCVAVTNQGWSTGLSQYRVETQGNREAILNSASGWVAEYALLNQQPSYWSNPTRIDGTQDYIQMIWVSATQVGCGYSDSAADFSIPGMTARYLLVCLWTPGIDDAGYQQNVLQDLE